MKSITGKILIVAALLTGASLCASAQNSAPAPGSGGSFTPNTGGGPGFGGGGPGFGGPGPGWGGPAWGGPWGGGWQSSPSIIVNVPISSPTWQNKGVTNVVGVGYDAQGVYRTVPMTVSYNYNGQFYNVVVENAWNPWTDMWNRGIDEQAFNTSYYFRGQNYDFYTVLPFGTFYFNL